MKNFKKFLEEVTIKGNPGIPGEGKRADRQDGDSNYLRDTERRAKDRLELRGGEQPHEFGRQIMPLVGQSQNMARGKEAELEKLAYDIIMSNYGDILEGVELDIKFATPPEIQENLEDCDGDCDVPDDPDMRHIEDEDMIRRIHKAKLSNNIIQGEAKNTKHIIHSEECKDGLREIFGDTWERIFNIWDQISKLADKLDWIIPVNIKADMMENQPQGMAGSVRIDWEKEIETDAKFSTGDYSVPGDTPEAQPEEDNDKPVIRARGIDFPMLIHETVKGIYGLIGEIAYPDEDAPEEEIEQANIIRYNISSFEDEAEEFRTGPEIAADLRDFINQNEDTTKYNNIREFVYGKMMDEEYMTPDEFLKLFRGILNKSDEARQKVDSIIEDIVKDLRDYEVGDVLGEYEQPEAPVEPEAVNEPEPEEQEVDYSSMSEMELTDLINSALDDGDIETVRKLSGFLKEGKEIYLREIEMINENHSYQNRK